MRWLRNLFLVLVATLGLLLVLVEGWGDPIARRVVEAVTVRWPTTVTVAEYDLSLLRAFPHLSAELNGVRVTGSDGSTLLKVKSVGCLLDLGSLLGTPRITEVRLRNGKIQLLTDVDGNTNYQLTGYTSVGDQAAEEGGADAGAVLFRIDRAKLEHVVVSYRDDQLRTDALLRVNAATFSGEFAADRYALTTRADLRVGYLDQEGNRYLTDRPFGIDGQTVIDKREGSYTFSPLRIESGDLALVATGRIATTDDGLQTQLELSSAADRLEDLIALLPAEYTGSVQELETRGDLNLQVMISGNWTASEYPRLDGNLRFTEGRVSHPRTDITGRGLTLEATFAFLDGPRGGVQTLSIDRLSGRFGGEPFELALRVEDVNRPRIDFRADGNFPLATLPALLGDSVVAQADGLLQLDNLQLRGAYADMLRPRRMGRVASSGTITAAGARLSVNNRLLELPTGQLTLGDNMLEITGLEVSMDRTALTLDGRAENFIPVLFADSLNTQDAALTFRGTLTGESLDLAEVLALTGPSEAEQASAAAAGSTDSLLRSSKLRRARITDLLDGRFESRLASWSWDELTGTDFRGQFIFRPGQVEIIGETDAMDGHIRTEVTSYFGFTDRIEARISATGVEVSEFFRQSGNFGQSFLTDDHLNGRMNAQMVLDLYYREDGTVDYDELRALVGMEILNGELRNFGLLEEFAYALKAGDLKRVRFERLSNYFEIRDRTVYLPAMFIQSSAVNLTLSAAHTFDQDLAYYLKLNAGQVLANKISRHDRELEVLPARNGLFNLYYTIRGPLANYAVATDRRAVKTAFRRSGYRRDRIERRLRERFRDPIAFRPTEDEGEDL